MKCRIRGMNELETLKIMTLYKQEISKGMSQEYAKCYANVIIFLNKNDKIARKIAEIQADMYEEITKIQDNNDEKEIIYANYYSKVKANQIWRKN